MQLHPIISIALPAVLLVAIQKGAENRAEAAAMPRRAHNWLSAARASRNRNNVRQRPPAYNDRRGRRLWRQCPRVRHDYYFRRRTAAALASHMGGGRFALCRRAAASLLCRRRRLGRAGAAAPLVSNVCRRMQRVRRNKVDEWRQGDYYRKPGHYAQASKCDPTERKHYDTSGEKRDRMGVWPCRDLSRWNSLQPLPATCNWEETDPGRCFSFVRTERYPHDPLDRHMIRLSESDPWEAGDTPSYWPYMVCANANMGRAATINSERILRHVAALVPDDYGESCAFVDGYPRDWKTGGADVRGNRHRDQWITAYGPHLPAEYLAHEGRNKSIPMSQDTWGEGQPRDPRHESFIDASKGHNTNTLACACLWHKDLRVHSTRCRHWRWSTCEYTRDNPKHCIPLKDEPTRCFKLKRTAVKNYADWYWRPGDANQFHARECHDRAPGRLANINSKQARWLATELVNTKMPGNTEHGVMVDGMPVRGTDYEGRPLSNASGMGVPSKSPQSSEWRAGSPTTTIHAKWWREIADSGSNVPSTESATCASLYKGWLYDNYCYSASINKVKYDWNYIICEYRTTIGSVQLGAVDLPPQGAEVKTMCNRVLMDHIYRTCQSVQDRIYEFSCPGKATLDRYVKLNAVTDCCSKRCRQQVFVYHCCFNKQMYNVYNTDIQQRMLDDFKAHDITSEGPPEGY